jgi:hypothetical protein
MVGGKAMSAPSFLAFVALVAMVIFYALDDRSQLAPLGFSAASVVAALSEFILGRWPFGLVALAFAGGGIAALVCEAAPG